MINKMTSNFTNLIESMDNFFAYFINDNRTDSHYLSNIDLQLKIVLVAKWSGIAYEKVEHMQVELKMNNTYPLYTVLHDNKLIYIFTSKDYLRLQKLLPLEYEFVNQIVEPTSNFFQQLMRMPNTEILYFKQEILNIFFRLTQYTDGSLVPLIDLMNQDSMFLFYKNEDAAQNKIAFMAKFMEYKKAIEGFLYTLLKMNTNFPSPYYYKMSVFEKTSGLQKALIDLEKMMFKDDIEKL